MNSDKNKNTKGIILTHLLTSVTLSVALFVVSFLVFELNILKYPEIFLVPVITTYPIFLFLTSLKSKHNQQFLYRDPFRVLIFLLLIFVVYVFIDFKITLPVWMNVEQYKLPRQLGYLSLTFLMTYLLLRLDRRIQHTKKNRYLKSDILVTLNSAQYL